MTGINGKVLAALVAGGLASTLAACGGDADRKSGTAAPAATAAPAPAPPAQIADDCSKKHDALVVHMRGDAFTLGNFSVSLSGQGVPTGVSNVAADGAARVPRRVHVWKDMTPEESAKLAPQSIAVRKAYLERPDGSLQFICDIAPDLDLDKMGDVAAAVGVELPTLGKAR